MQYGDDSQCQQQQDGKRRADRRGQADEIVAQEIKESPRYFRGRHRNAMQFLVSGALGEAIQKTGQLQRGDQRGKADK